MTWLDRFLQAWRIRKAAAYVGRGERVLDIGAADGALFARVPGLGAYVGIEPRLEGDRVIGQGARLVAGMFPGCAVSAGEELFDCVTALAVLEHVPEGEQAAFAAACAARVRPGGRVVVTVPSRWVDSILAVLEKVGLVHGIAMEQHYGFDANKTAGLFEAAGLRMVRRERFQCGLNNLFVFERGRCGS